MSFQTGNGCAAGIASPIGDAARPFNQIGKGIGMEWKDQYKHPSWQRKRLEAMEAAEFTCQRCYDKDTTLNVHHRRYVKGRKVWEYELRELEVLCEPCHEEFHAEKEVMNQLLARIPTECWSEITAILASYCTNALGPIVTAKSQDIVDGLNSPWATGLGHLAAVAGELRNIQVILDLISQIEVNRYGGVIHIDIPKRKPLIDDIGF